MTEKSETGQNIHDVTDVTAVGVQEDPIYEMKIILVTCLFMARSAL